MAAKKNILLYPFSVLYGMVTGVRNFLYNTGFFESREFSIPIICVGNITVGGTGKTPHSEYLLELLGSKYRVALLSRGYRRKSSGFRIAGEGDNVNTIGDEPYQVYRKIPGLLVAVSRNRVKGVEEIIIQSPETDVIVLDDGFQHRSLKPGLTILLTDYNRLMLDDHLLPYGELRESLVNMYRADIILVTKSPATLSPMERRIIVKNFNKAAYQHIYFTTFTYKDALPVFRPVSRGGVKPEGPVTKGENIVVVTGIANPDPFIAYLSGSYHVVRHFRFGDHHEFTRKDIESIITCFNDPANKCNRVITTEKDAVRLQEFANIADLPVSAFWYIPVGVQFLNEDGEEFDNLVTDYVRKNIRNYRVSEGQRI
ncbi:MAG: tetraacyldisaccharide 4'-kinase [Bacteroidales bacterium]